MSVGPSNQSNGAPPGLTTGIGLALESLVQLPGSRWLKECLSTFGPYGATPSSDPCPDPIAGSSNLILADRSTRPATRHQPRAQAESRPSRRRAFDRQSWLRDVSKKHAFVISSAAMNSLFLVMPYAQNCWAALPTIISNTTYQTSAVGVSVSAVFEGGTIQVDQATIYTTNFTLNNSNGNTIDNNGFNATFSGVFSNGGVDSGVINFIDGSGGGTITLTGNNTYTGSTTIASGATLALTGDG